ncbi:MAG: protein translocase subunit SecF [Propionibacteriaceae bacterium]
MSKFGNLGHRLYVGDVSYEFIGRRKRWYTISAILIAVSIAALLIRGLSLGIEFRGGADFQATTTVTSQTVTTMRTAVEDVKLPDMEGLEVTTIGGDRVQIQTRSLNVDEVAAVRGAIANEVGINSDEVAYSLIGPSWGKQISQQGLIALLVFLVLVSLVIWAYFRNGTMSIAALVALIHDLIITVGIYALVGFTVTPATLIGVLTILGYSLYDTVVVFDKVRENVRDIKSSTTRTYSEAANLAVNQVLVRSINTTIIGVLPVAALLFAGTVILGTGPLQDLALALFVGMISGAYSSIFIASPLLAQLKEREPDMQKLATRVRSRRDRETGTTATKKTVRPTAVEAASSGSDDVADTAGRADAGPTTEPTTEKLAAAGVERGSSSITVRVNHGRVTTSDGAAKRPQPQKKPRSQRRK